MDRSVVDAKDGELRAAESHAAAAGVASDTRWAVVVLLGLPALTAALVSADTIWNEFVYDDRWTLRRIPSFSLATVADALSQSRGLTYLVHSLDKWLWGNWSPGFHITNVLLHASVTALVATATYMLTARRRVAVVCGLLFAVHPVHVEVVASFSNRKDLLAMLFVLLGLISWLGTRRPRLCYFGTVVCLGLGLLSKEVAVVGLVPILFLVDLLPGHGHPAEWSLRRNRAVRRFLPLLAAALAASIWFMSRIPIESISHSIMHRSNGAVDGYQDVFTTVVGSVTEVARLLVYPMTLSADYPIYAQTDFISPRVLGGGMLLGYWLLGTIWLSRRAPVAALAAAWTLLMYLPCSNVLPLTHYFVAERYLYAPSFGVCLLAAMGIDGILVHARQRRRVWLARTAAAFATVLIVVGGVRSFARGRDWRNGNALWSASLRAGIVTDRVHGNLAASLLRTDHPEEAVEHLTIALRLHKCTRWLRPLSKACVRSGRLDEAEAHCRTILATEPDDAETRARLDRLVQRRRQPS